LTFDFEAFCKPSGIAAHRVLSREEEKTLGEAIRKGGKLARKARNRLVEGNLRLVLKRAAKWSYEMPIADLFQAGVLSGADLNRTW
jgi:DNA-directed RNA polymerase sigma subunit (sigma70/sigma32)